MTQPDQHKGAVARARGLSMIRRITLGAALTAATATLGMTGYLATAADATSTTTTTSTETTTSSSGSSSSSESQSTAPESSSGSLADTTTAGS
jgi:hypothetical protein